MPTVRLALLVSAAALASPAALAALDNYTIDLRRETRGLDIAATATNGPIASLQVSNRTSSRVRCFVDFEGGRLTPARREAWLDAGTVATVRQTINDPDISTLDVGLSCETLGADEQIPPSGLVIRGMAQGGTGLPATQPVSPVAPPRPVVPASPVAPARSTGTTTIISPR